MYVLIGHDPLLQTCVCLIGPSHALPPSTGTMQRRSRAVVPSPQRAEQLDQHDHCDHSPSKRNSSSTLILRITGLSLTLDARFQIGDSNIRRRAVTVAAAVFRRRFRTVASAISRRVLSARLVKNAPFSPRTPAAVDGTRRHAGTSRHVERRTGAIVSASVDGIRAASLSSSHAVETARHRAGTPTSPSAPFAIYNTRRHRQT